MRDATHDVYVFADAAGNTTAAIGKGFAIGSAALVSLALFGAYVTRSKIDLVHASILDPKVFAGLLVGAMLPYWFSAMTMKSVGKAALAMVEEVSSRWVAVLGMSYVLCAVSALPVPWPNVGLAASSSAPGFAHVIKIMQISAR